MGTDIARRRSGASKPDIRLAPFDSVYFSADAEERVSGNHDANRGVRMNPPAGDPDPPRASFRQIRRQYQRNGMTHVVYFTGSRNNSPRPRPPTPLPVPAGAALLRCDRALPPGASELSGREHR